MLAPGLHLKKGLFQVVLLFEVILFRVVGCLSRILRLHVTYFYIGVMMEVSKF